jgi:hypothetical protein
MNATLPSNAVKAPRRRWLLIALFALAAVAALFSMRRLAQVEADGPALASAPRFRLETRGGRLFRIGESMAFSGWVTDHYTNGAVRLRTGVAEGRLHGVSEGWHENGALELREHFEKGVPHGTRATWHANGQKRSEGQLVMGRQQGMYRQWDEEGRLMAEAEFAAGKPHGLSRAWHPSGCLKAEALMRHGEIEVRHVYPDGARREPALLAGAAAQ